MSVAFPKCPGFSENYNVITNCKLTIYLPNILYLAQGSIYAFGLLANWLDGKRKILGYSDSQSYMNSTIQ